MKELDIKIKLPAEITVHMPALGDISIESVYEAIGTNGLKLLQDIIFDRVMDAFIAEQEPFIKEKVAELLEEKRDDLKKLLAPTLTR